jgi:hypothetical protein
MNMIENIVITIITTLIGYFVGYRKSKNEVEGGRLENLEKSIHIYQIVIDDLGKKVEELTIQIAKLEGMIDGLKKENKRLKEYKGI